jgi:O-antigen ligase
MLALGGGLLTLLIRRDLLHFPLRGQLMLVVLGLMALGTPFATNRYWAFIQTRDFALFLFGALVPLMSFVNTYARLRRLVTVLIAIHIPLAIYGITHDGIGIGSFLGDENDFCLALNIIIPYAFFSLYFVRGGHKRAFLLLTSGLLLVAIVSTSSRGGFVGLLAVGIYCWLASHRKMVSMFVIALIAVPILAMTPAGYWTEIGTISTATENDDTGAKRLYYWNIAWEIFKDHPVVGVGPTNYRWTAPQYESAGREAMGQHIWGRAVHSLFYTLLSELGVVGTLLVVALLVLNFRENRRVRRAYALLSQARAPSERLQKLYVLSMLTRANDAALVAYLVTGAFLSVLYYPHLWLQVSIGIVLTRTANALMAEPDAEAEDPARAPAPRAYSAVLRPARV